MKQLLAMCILSIFFIGCTTTHTATPLQNSIEPKPIAATPEQPSKPEKTVEVVVEIEPGTPAQPSHHTQPLISITQEPQASQPEKTIEVVIETKVATQAHATLHEEIVIEPRPVSSDAHQLPQSVTLSVTLAKQSSQTQPVHTALHEEIVIEPHHVSSHARQLPRDIILTEKPPRVEQPFDTKQTVETFFVKPVQK